jgi:hypothetical protein
MVPIWPHRPDARWLYVEQARAGYEDRPYRQRVYRVSSAGDGSLISEVYAIPDPLRFAGAWRDDAPLSALSPDSLVIREGCAVRLRRSGNAFKGGTTGRECVSKLRGAAFATSEVIVTPDMLVSWDRGYDEDSTQVWGAEGGGYVFRKTR